MRYYKYYNSRTKEVKEFTRKKGLRFDTQMKLKSEGFELVMKMTFHPYFERLLKEIEKRG